MSEKEKPKRGSKMSLLRSCLIFALYPLCILTVLGMGLAYWAIGGYVKPSLDAQYIPTAEYLLENPIFEGSISAEPHTNLYLWTDNVDNRICVTFQLLDIQLFWSELYINEQIVNRLQWDTGYINSLPYGGSTTWVYGHLDSGLHIIEMRVKESLFAEPYYIQRWAIEIP